MEDKNYTSRIVIDPKVMVGKPIVKGTRLTVQYILNLMAQGMSVDEVIHEYNNLTRDDVLACLTFARDTLENTTFAPLMA